MIVIEKETPHMFMWFSDGSKIPSGISPLPQNTRLNYSKRLKEECKKLFVTKTPVYLVYMGRLLNKEQITLLEDLQNDIPNLAVIDYEQVERSIADESINTKVAATANAYKKYEKLDIGSGGIADLVDLTRLVLVYNSKGLREIAQKKINISLQWREGLIYRDFDVTLKKETMPDIPTTYGYIATLNFQEKLSRYYIHLMKSAKERNNEDLMKKIDHFFRKHIFNLDNYQHNLKLFLSAPLNTEEETEKQILTLEFNEILSKNPMLIGDNFTSAFINSIRIENSFLAINKDEHPIIHEMIQGVISLNESPYAAVQLSFYKAFKSLGRLHWLKEFLTPQLLGFHVGNDLTWKIEVREQYAVADIQQRKNTHEDIVIESVIDRQQENLSARDKNKDTSNDMLKVYKLSQLSKDYLSHLEQSSRKNNYIDKYEIMRELHAILDHPSKSPSAKLMEFSNRLQEVDKGKLKNPREPTWAFFKKTALFILGVTVVGAVIGLIDYALRGHHSIFCSANSHGERFILDVEKYIPLSHGAGI